MEATNKKSGGKKLRAVREKVDTAKKYAIADAIKVLQENKVAKFDETLELVIRLGVNAANSDQNVRGVAVMPGGTGKKIRVAVIAKEDKHEIAKKAGADIVGLDDLIEAIKEKKIDFDVCIATPDVMPKISAVAKILGPKGLMPNPKLGTVTVDIESAVKQAKSGQVEFRTEKAGIVHAGVGKLSFTLNDLVANVQALVKAIIKAKPASSKGSYLKEVFVASTMGIALKVDIASITN